MRERDRGRRESAEAQILTLINESISSGTLSDSVLRKAQELAPPGDTGMVYSILYSHYVLDTLVDEGKIAGHSQTKQYSEDDINGIDFWIFLEDGTKVPMSITGSIADKGLRRKKHPEIPTIYIKKDVYRKGKRTGMRTRSLEVLKKVTLNEISNYLQGTDTSEVSENE